MRFFNFNFLNPLGHLCLLCHESTRKKLALCDDCEKILPHSNDALIQTNSHHTKYFNQTVILFAYLFPIDKLITRLKFQHQLINASLFGELLSNKISQLYHNQDLPSLLIPVPLHIKRLQERGFNQALEIAKPISKKLNIPIDKKNCMRIRHTEAQSSLSQSDRLKNMTNAFELKKPLKYKHIALIDDVMTTGQTLRELAKTLRQNGAEKIDVWCCAKTPQGRLR